MLNSLLTGKNFSFNIRLSIHFILSIICRNLFVKPNQTAFEYVTYFLLNLLNPKDCQTRFRDCFPAVERQQQSEFRKVALESLREISKVYN